MSWSVPKIGGLLAAFQETPDGLVPAEGQNDVQGHLPRAQMSAALWSAVQQVPGTAMMMVKSDVGASIGLLSGGLIVEGTKSINLGLVRAATRQLDPIAAVDPESRHTPSATNFRRSMWQILSRLDGAKLTRAFRFDLGGTSGQILSQAGKYRFAGDFTDPASFVAAVAKACDGDQDVSYTLEDPHDRFEQDGYSTADFIREIAEISETEKFEFDPDGWPLICPADVDFETVQMLSYVAVTACAMSDVNGDLSLSAMSADNKPVLSGQTTADRSMELSLSSG